MPEMFAELFDDPERDTWQKPDEVITSFNVSADAIIVEIGAGTGYFTVRLAERFKEGKVISLDSAPQMVAYLKKRIEGLMLKNVDVHLVENIYDVHLNEPVDIVVCVDAYHHIADRVTYFSQLASFVKNNGKLAIIDRPKNSPVSPPHAHQTTPELVIKEMEEAGFELIDDLDFLLPYQFYLLFRKSDKKK